jgi:type IV pilus assembly protein PilM
MVEFLSLSKDAFGLEITDTAVRMVKLARRGGKPVVVTASWAPVGEGVIRDGNVKDEKRLAAAIKAAAANPIGRSFGTRRVVVSLPESKSFLQVVRMPELRGSELRAAVVFEAENHIPLPLEKVYLDFERIEPAAADGVSGCEVLIAALPREPIDARLRAVVAAGLVPAAMELESQAVARAVLEPGIAKSRLIIQIGDTKTNLVIHSNGSIRFTFSIPVSNRYFLEKILANAGTSIAEADNLKVKFGIEEFMRLTERGEENANYQDSRPAAEKRKIFEALIPGLVDFIQQVKKCVQYYQTHDNIQPADSIDKILICGSGANLKGIDEFIALKLGAPVERVLPRADVKLIESQFGQSAPRQDASAFCVAVGLAMRALEDAAGEKAKTKASRTPATSKRMRLRPRER